MLKPNGAARVDSAHAHGVWAVGWKGDKIISGGVDGACKLWNLKKEGDVITGIEKENVPSTGKYGYGVTSVAFSSGGEFGVSCTQDSLIRIFDVENEMRILGEINAGNLEAWTACMSPNDDVIAAGSHTGAINFYSVEKKEHLGVRLETGNKLIMSSTFSPDGTKIASVSYDGFMYIHDISSAQLLHKIQAHYLPVRKVMFSSAGQMLWTASDDRHIGVFDVNTGLNVNTYSHAGMCTSLDLSSDKHHVAVATSDHSVTYWDMAMQRRLQVLDAPHTEYVWDVKFDETGKKIVSVGDDGIIQIYE